MRAVSQDDCMLYAGAKNRNGYALKQVKDNETGKWNQRALHREMYIAEYGSVDDSLVMDHLCRNRCCVNTDHLEPVTNTENLNRGNRPKVWGKYCNSGHLVTPESHWITKRGTRKCKQCCSAWERATRAAKKLQTA